MNKTYKLFILIAVLLLFGVVKMYGQCVNATVVALPDNDTFCYELGVDHTYNIELSPLQAGEDGYHIKHLVGFTTVLLMDVTTNVFTVTNDLLNKTYWAQSYGAGCEAPNTTSFYTRASKAESTSITSTQCDDGSNSLLRLDIRGWSTTGGLLELSVYGSATTDINDAVIVAYQPEVGNGVTIYKDVNVSYAYYFLQVTNDLGCVSVAKLYEKVTCPTAPIISNVPSEPICEGETVVVNVDNASLPVQRSKYYSSSDGVNYYNGTYIIGSNELSVVSGAYYKVHSLSSVGGALYESTDYAEFQVSEIRSVDPIINLDMPEIDDAEYYHYNCSGATEITGEIRSSMLYGSLPSRSIEPIESMELFGVWEDAELGEQTESIHVFTLEEVELFNTDNKIPFVFTKNVLFNNLRVVASSPNATCFNNYERNSTRIDWLEDLLPPTVVNGDQIFCYDEPQNVHYVSAQGGTGVSYNWYQKQAYASDDNYALWANSVENEDVTVLLYLSGQTQNYNYYVTSVNSEGCESEPKYLDFSTHSIYVPKVLNTYEGNVGSAIQYASCGDVATMNLLMEDVYYDGVVSGKYEELSSFKIYGYNGNTIVLDNLIEEFDITGSELSFDILKETGYEEYVIIGQGNCEYEIGKRLRIIWTDETLAPVEIVDYHSNVGSGTIEFTITENPDADFNQYYYWLSDTLDYVLHWDQEGVNNDEYYYDDSQLTVSYTLNSFEGDSFKDTLYVYVDHNTQRYAPVGCTKVDDNLNIPFYFEWLKAPEAFTISTSSEAICRLGEIVSSDIISPDATTEYRWYNGNDELIFTGTSFDQVVEVSGDIKVVGVKNNLETDPIYLAVTETISSVDHPTIISLIDICYKGELASLVVDEDKGMEYNWLDASDNYLETGVSYSQTIESTTEIKVFGIANGCHTDTTSITLNYSIDRALDNPVILSESEICYKGDLASLVVDRPKNMEYKWLDASDNLLATGVGYEPIIESTTEIKVFGIANGCHTDTTSIVLNYNIDRELETPIVSSDGLVCRSGEVEELSIDNASSELSYKWLNGSGDVVGTATSISYQVDIQEELRVVAFTGECTTDTTRVQLSINLADEQIIPTIDGNTFSCMESDESSFVVTNANDNYVYSWIDEADNVLFIGLTYTCPIENGKQLRVFGVNGACMTDTTSVLLGSAFDRSETITSSTDEVFVNEQIDFSANLIDASLYEYEWSFGDGNLSIGESANHSYEIKGVFDVNLLLTEIESGCELILDLGNNINVLDIISATHDDLFFKIELFPNPTVDYINIAGVANITTYKIVNVQGKIVQSGQGKSSIDVSGIQQGSYYMIVITEDDKTYLRKFIKE